MQHQVSRLEHDEIDRPSMRDIVRIISCYGVTPNEVAQKAYDWVPPKEYRGEDYRWTFAEDVLAKLDDNTRDDFLRDLYDKAMFYSRLAESQS